MFRPLCLFSKATDPVPCPALLDGEPCIIPQCFFSHDVCLPLPLSAPPPPFTPTIAPTPVITPVSVPAPTESDDNGPLPTVVPKKTADRRLRDIVEGKKIPEAKKTQDLVAASDKRPRSAELQCGFAKDAKDTVKSATKGTSRAVEIGKVSTGASSNMAESDTWPTPAQSSKKLKTSKTGGSDVSIDEFHGPHVCFLLRPKGGPSCTYLV